jgi:hypothetical protein
MRPEVRVAGEGGVRVLPFGFVEMSRVQGAGGYLSELGNANEVGRRSPGQLWILRFIESLL